MCLHLQNHHYFHDYFFLFPQYYLLTCKHSSKIQCLSMGAGSIALIAVFHAIFKQSYAKCHIELWKINMLIIFMNNCLICTFWGLIWMLYWLCKPLNNSCIDILHYPDNQSCRLIPKSCRVTTLPTMIGDVILY